MRTSKIAAVVGLVGGLVWIAAAALSWGDKGLEDPSPLLWWVGLGFFALASGLTGYTSVTDSPFWLKAVVTLGAAALGGSILSAVDIDAESAYVVVTALGGAVTVLGLVGLAVRGRQQGSESVEPVIKGRRAAR